MENDNTPSRINSTSEYASIDAIDEAVDYLKKPGSFRSFREGLIELLKKKGYSGDLDNVAEMTEYLLSKLGAIDASVRKDPSAKKDSSIGKGTVASWFSGKHSPEIRSDSRLNMYKICFSLNLTYEETLWFFQNVYYDRAFNCHTIEETVYYYAFLNGTSYREVNEIIREIAEAPVVAANNHGVSNYTMFVRRRVSEFRSTEELKEFLITNKGNFDTWNESASKVLHNLVNLFINPPEIEKEIRDLKRLLSQKRILEFDGKIQDLHLTDLPVYQKCGLLMKEILFDAQYPDKNFGDGTNAPARAVMELIENQHIRSNDFILLCLLTTFTSSGVKKNMEIPDIVRNNFPSKKAMSEILSEKKISTSTSYDRIRKMIILLDFYRFWVNVKLGIGYTDLTREELFKTYLDEAENCLLECGYEGLCEWNPYDWIFWVSAQSEEPLAYFRAYISELDDVL